MCTNCCKCEVCCSCSKPCECYYCLCECCCGVDAYYWWYEPFEICQCCECCECYKDIFHVHYDDTNKKGMIFRFLIFLIPVIIDIILTAKFFEESNLYYYKLRFASQGLAALFCLVWAWRMSYKPEEDENGIGNIAFGIIVGITLFFFLPFLGLEISSLVYFIIDYKDINLMQKITFYCHWIFIPYLIIISKCLNC